MISVIVRPWDGEPGSGKRGPFLEESGRLPHLQDVSGRAADRRQVLYVQLGKQVEFNSGGWDRTTDTRLMKPLL